MAIAPNDPRHPDLTASDVLAPNSWPKRGVRPLVGLDVICTKIAVDFQTMTAETTAGCLQTNLELLREATRADAAFHINLDTEGSLIVDVQVARGMLATGNPEQLKGQSLDALPWLKSRLAALRVSELRDTGHPRPDQADDAAVWANLGIGSILVIGYFIEGRPAGILGIAAARELGSAAAPAHEAGRLEPRHGTRAHRDPTAPVRLGRAQRAGAVQRQRRALGFRHLE
jgi:hypothetical protein